MERKWDMGLEEHEPLEYLKITMFGKVYELQPAADLELHPSTVGEDLQRQPSQYAFYASVHSMAISKVNALQKKLEQVRSEIDDEIRSSGILPGGGKITEDGLRRAIRAHPNSVAFDDAINKASHEALILGNIVRAFEHRRECLIELAKRTANTTFNDQDVNITVSANIRQAVSAATAQRVGQHPSKK